MTSAGAVDHALAYAALGWPVFPLEPGQKRPHKRLAPNGFRGATRDPAAIRAWFSDAPTAGVALHPWPAGTVVLDIDTKAGKQGRETLAALEASRGELPATLTARTPSGGEHRIFRCTVPLGNHRLGQDIDVRCADGYIACEPTVIDGKAYQWIDWDVTTGEIPEIADLPQWVLDVLMTAQSVAAMAEQARVPVSVIVAPATVTELRSALNAIEADDYDVWMRMGMALKALGTAGRELWLTWSQTSTKYDPGEAARKWAELQPRACDETRQDGTVAHSTGHRAVFAEAARRGWTNPRSRAATPSAMDCGPNADLGDSGGRNAAAGFHLVDVRELMDNPIKLEWLVEGMIECPGVGAIVGPSGSGKSFIAIDLACCIATGTSWIGKATLTGPVIYIAGEGKIGLVRRVHGWEQAHGIAVPKSVLFLNGSAFEMEREQRRDLVAATIAQGIKPALIVLDTLARTFMPGEDENNAMAMMQYIREADALRDEFNCVVLIVHHTGHAFADRARGSSAFRAALDLEVNVSSMGMKCTKAKEAEPFETVPFEIASVSIDSSGAKSAAVRWTPSTSSHPSIDRVPAALQRAMNSLREACTSSGELTTKDQIGVQLEAWRDHYYKASTSDNLQAKKKAFQRDRNKLAHGGYMTCESDVYTPIWAGAQDTIALLRQSQRDTGHRRDIVGHVPVSDERMSGHMGHTP